MQLPSGPTLLTIAACAIYAGLSINENIEYAKIKSSGDVLLSTCIQNLSLKADQKDREAASKHLYEYLRVSVGKKQEDLDEKCDIIKDHGGLKLLTQIIANPNEQSETTLANVLTSIQLLVRGSSEQRNAFNSYKGVYHLFQLALNSSVADKIKQAAMVTLRTATRFDVNKREVDSDIPFGSEGAQTVARQNKEQVGRLVDILDSSDNQKVKPAIGVIAHMSQTLEGAKLLNDLDAVNLLVPHLHSTDPGIKKNALIAIANAAKQNIDKSIAILGEADQYTKILNMLPKRDPTANQKVKRSVVDILLLVGSYFFSKSNGEETEELAQTLASNQDSLVIIIYYGLTTGDFRLKRSVTQLQKLLTNVDFSSLSAQFKDQIALLAARLEAQKRQDQQRQQQQAMAQMMMGGGMGGMGGLSAQEMAMMQQMYGQ